MRRIDARPDLAVTHSYGGGRTSVADQRTDGGRRRSLELLRHPAPSLPSSSAMIGARLVPDSVGMRLRDKWARRRGTKGRASAAGEGGGGRGAAEKRCVAATGGPTIRLKPGAFVQTNKKNHQIIWKYAIW